MAGKVERWEFKAGDQKGQGTLTGIIDGIEVTASYNHCRWIGEVEELKEWHINACYNDTDLGEAQYQHYFPHGEEPGSPFFKDLDYKPKIRGSDVVRDAYNLALKKYQADTQDNLERDFARARRVIAAR